MFTGLVEEVGGILSRSGRRGSVVFDISGRKTLSGLNINDSVAVNGVCLTVIKRRQSSFQVQAVEETVKKTTLGDLRKGSLVNLERPLRPSDRLGGHFVLGHVDGLGVITGVETRSSSWLFWIRVPGRFAHYLIPVGSIAVNGVSLTIADVESNQFAVSIIPRTMEVTTFGILRKGQKVNLEFDVLGKYVERFIKLGRNK